MPYTIGDITRLGCFTTKEGVPVDKSAVSRIVRLNMKFTIKKTPFGESKVVSESELKRYLAKRRENKNRK